MLSRISFLLFVLCCFSGSIRAESKTVLFLAGEPSHGWNEHEFPTGCYLLAEALRDSGLGIEASVSRGWPEIDDAFEGVDAVVVYCDGGSAHLAENRVDDLRGLFEQGMSFAFLHYALEPESEELADFLLDSIGGYFDVNWSVNPVWNLENGRLGKVEAAQGIESPEIKDEWYYHMRFREDGGYKPLLSSLPPISSLGENGLRSGNAVVRAKLEAGEEQHLAWVRESGSGQRGFGFTGGHFHSNWNDNSFRTLVLNAIAWTAGVSVPEGGLVSQIPNIATYKTIEEAIARGALDDVKVHLSLKPELLNMPGRGDMTPLHQAIMRKKVEIARFLLEIGADPNHLTSSEQTSLHLAVSRNLPELCTLLKEARVDVGARDNAGGTALHWAAAKDQLEMVQELLSIGSDVNALSAAGGTALHEAAASGGEKVIQVLLDAGADVTVVSNHGVTALDIGIEYKKAAAISLLED